VTDLTVYSLSTFPTASQLSMLPTCIKYLDLDVSIDNVDAYDHKCDWTDETLQSLPRSLYVFYINAMHFPNLTKRMYEYLPPNLQDSSLTNYIMNYESDEDSFIDFKSPLDRLH